MSATTRRRLNVDVESWRAVDLWDQVPGEALAEQFEVSVARWSPVGETFARSTPSRDQPDEVLAADLREKVGEQSRPLTQDEVRERDRVGATRAARIRVMAECSPASTRSSGRLARSALGFRVPRPGRR